MQQALFATPPSDAWLFSFGSVATIMTLGLAVKLNRQAMLKHGSGVGARAKTIRKDAPCRCQRSEYIPNNCLVFQGNEIRTLPKSVDLRRRHRYSACKEKVLDLRAV